MQRLAALHRHIGFIAGLKVHEKIALKHFDLRVRFQQKYRNTPSSNRQGTL
jgi:hypothetical protein